MDEAVQVNQKESETSSRFTVIDEYIFAPFDTYLYLDTDELDSIEYNRIQRQVIHYLSTSKNQLVEGVRWFEEESYDLKASKGVFAVPGKENSFICVQISNFERYFELLKSKHDPLLEQCVIVPKDVTLFFNESGVGSCSQRIQIQRLEGISIPELEQISELLNLLFKEYLEDICYELTKQFLHAIKTLQIPHFQFEFLPTITEVERSKAFLPWTHRIYHIENDEIFEQENPGIAFKHLLTPVDKEDIRNLAIYQNRYIYFGWGHSLILSKEHLDDVYSQTTFKVENYVRLVQVAQTNWHCLDNISKLIDLARISFYGDIHKKKKKLKMITKNIIRVRNFTKCIDGILESFDGTSITFDTEKRKLLSELHSRWLYGELKDKVKNKLNVIDEFLDFLYVRKKEQRDGSLSMILSIITILSIVEIFKSIIEFSSPVFQLDPKTSLLLLLGSGLFALMLVIFITLRD
ncbi:hypothetical protein LCL95_15445 [Bacillus timonensis]|nr:hypothetical protein [Bacillus timonensis]